MKKRKSNNRAGPSHNDIEATSFTSPPPKRLNTKSVKKKRNTKSEHNKV
jgi:hypothetical protein